MRRFPAASQEESERALAHIDLSRGAANTGDRADETADEYGYFAFSHVPRGSYTIHASSEGFVTAEDEVVLAEASSADDVLLVELVSHIDLCSTVRTESWKLAQEIQSESQARRRRANP